LFIYRRWNKASNELQSHVISSRSRKAVASRSTAATIAAPPPSSGGSLLGALGGRVSRLFSGSAKEGASEHQAVVPAKTHTKRSYGFATSNLSHFSDRNSEDLYRYKNISSDYMRETSPTRNNDDDDQPAAASGGSRLATRRNENVDRSSMASGTRRAAARKRNDDDRSTGAFSTGHFVPEKNDDDDDNAATDDKP
jgi:hypothetical protein